MQRYREMWPHITLTATALVANWSVLGPKRRSAVERGLDEDCAYVPARSGPPAWESKKPKIDSECMRCGHLRALAEREEGRWLCRECWEEA